MNLKAFGSIIGGNPCPELHIPHKEWASREELENYIAIERWAKTRGCGACDCFVEHKEAIAQVIDGGATIGDAAVMYEVTWDTTNTCGTLTNDQSLMLLFVNWRWEGGSNDPYLDGYPTNNLISAKGVFITDDSNTNVIAGDTRIGLGQAWLGSGGGAPTWDYSDMGSLAIPLNIFPAGQDFHVWAAQNSGAARELTIRADRFTICGCECVL